MHPISDPGCSSVSPVEFQTIAHNEATQGSAGWGSGGGERDRTADLYVANVALSQLSYTPMMP